MTEKPLLTFGQASHIVNEAVRALEGGGIPLENYVSYKTDNEFYERLRGDDIKSMDYCVDDGTRLSLMDDFFNLFPDNTDTVKKIKPLEVLKLKIEDIGNAVRRIEFDGLMLEKTQEYLKNIAFYDLVNNRFDIQRPSLLQYSVDILDRNEGHNRIQEASRIHLMTRDLNSL